MSDSRNTVEAIPRNYATSVRRGGAAPQAIPAIQFLNTSLSPVSTSFFLSLSRFSIPRLPRLHTFSSALSRLGSLRAVTVDADAHACSD